MSKSVMGEPVYDSNNSPINLYLHCSEKQI